MAKKRIYTDEELKVINHRIGKIRTELCNEDNKLFAEMLDLTPQATSNICNRMKSVGNKTIERILSAFPQVNKSWLYTGEGDMLVSDTKVEQNSKITSTEKLFLELDAKNDMINKLLNQQEQFLNIINNLSIVNKQN
jgi:plasmid maintenance system antidote protein VapI